MNPDSRFRHVLTAMVSPDNAVAIVTLNREVSPRGRFDWRTAQPKTNPNGSVSHGPPKRFGPQLLVTFDQQHAHSHIGAVLTIVE